jgi:hypothetical protein
MSVIVSKSNDKVLPIKLRIPSLSGYGKDTYLSVENALAVAAQITELVVQYLEEERLSIYGQSKPAS